MTLFCSGVLASSTADPSSLLFSVKDLSTPIDLAPHIEFIEDPLHELDWDKIQQPEYQDRWVANKKSVFVTDNPNYRYWFRFSIDWQEYDDNDDAIFYLNFPPTLIHNVSFLIPAIDDKPTVFDTGYLRPYQQRDLNTYQYAFRLPINKTQPTVVYGYANNMGESFPVTLPLVLLSESEFENRNANYQYFMIFFYGFFFALIIYHTALYLKLKQRLYLVYVSFLFVAIGVCSGQDGSIVQFYSFDSPIAYLRCTWILSCLGTSWLFLFVSEALIGTSLIATGKRFYYMFVLLSFLMMIFFFVPIGIKVSTFIVQLYPIVVLLICAVMIVDGIVNQVPIAKYMLFSEISTLLGAIAFLMLLHGNYPINSLTIWSLHLGFFGEAVILSIGLAARRRELTRQTGTDAC